MSEEIKTRMLRRAEIVDLTGLSYPTLWRLMKADRFPQRRKLSPGRVGWREADVLNWLESRESAE